MTAKDTAYKYLSLIVVALLAMTACTSEDVSFDTGVPMTFTCDVAEQTRAGDGYTDYTGTSFGITVTEYKEDGSNPTVYWEMDNLKVTKAGYGNVWSTAGTYYWPKLNNLHFAAYSPYGISGITMPTSMAADDAYTFEGDIDGKTNLMFADKQFGKVGDFVNGSVPIKFNHALTRVKFQAKPSEAGCTLKIKSLALRNIRNNGKVTFTQDGNTKNMLWEQREGVSDYTALGGEVVEITKSDEYTSVGDILYLMPQQFSVSGDYQQQLVVTYTITRDGEEEAGLACPPPIPLYVIEGISEWGVNKSVCYSLEMAPDKSVALKVTVKDWTEVTYKNEFANTVSYYDDGFITWSGEKAIVDSLVFLDDDYSKPATLKFKLKGPVGGTWYAMFISKRGNHDAFEISPSQGTIDKSEGFFELTVRAKNAFTSETNMAELRFVVDNAGNILPVNDLARGKDFINYIIVQDINQ